MAEYLGAPFALGLNSGGSAIFLALKLAGVRQDKNRDNLPHLVQVTEGSPVLTNSYTLTPVPGAILHAGGVPVLGRVLEHQQHPLLSCSLQSSARRRVSKSTWKVWKSSRQPLGHVTCSSATWGASSQTWRASSSFAGGVNGDDCLMVEGQVWELTKVESQGPRHHPGGRLCSCARLKVARQSPWYPWASWMLQHPDQQADQQVRKPENPEDTTSFQWRGWIFGHLQWEADGQSGYPLWLLRALPHGEWDRKWTKKMLSLPQHIACPKDEELMLEAHARVPNFSLRMTPLAALLLLDQLPKVEAKIEALNRHYAILEAKLGGFRQGSK